jgi:Protein of unknown function (DUF2568).
MDTVGVHDVVAFFIEIGALVLLGVWAWRFAPERLIAQLFAVALVVGSAVVLWGLFAAPKATYDQPALAIAVKVLVIGGSLLAAYLILPTWVATSWAALVVVNTVAVTAMRLT